MAENIDAERAADRDVLDAFNDWMARRGPLGAGASPERIFIAGWAAGRRTPSPSIGEDGLPELPDTRAIRAGDSFPKVYALAYTADQMREYAREAVAADRRAHPRAMSNAEAAQWARDNGLNVPAQLEVTVTNYGNTVDKSAPEVKIERGRVWVVKGSQSFMLAYEPDADEPEATEWYANQLRGVLSSFTPCVNSAAQGEESLQAAQGVKTLPEDLLDELNDAVIEAFNQAFAIKDWSARDHWRDVLTRFEDWRAAPPLSSEPQAARNPPLDPTPEMIRAGREALRACGNDMATARDAELCWSAMIEAMPNREAA